MSAPLDPDNMLPEERNYYGLEPCNHVWGRGGWKERERLAKIRRECEAAARRARFDRMAFGVSFVEFTVDTESGALRSVKNVRP